MHTKEHFLSHYAINFSVMFSLQTILTAKLQKTKSKMVLKCSLYPGWWGFRCHTFCADQTEVMAIKIQLVSNYV